MPSRARDRAADRCGCDRHDVLEALVAAGADVNTALVQGWTALHDLREAERQR